MLGTKPFFKLVGFRSVVHREEYDLRHTDRNWENLNVPDLVIKNRNGTEVN